MNDPTNTRDYLIDSHINLSEIARAAKKHRLTMVETLAAKGCERRDAEAFADFTYDEDTTELTDEQWDRLTLASNQ